MQPSIMKAIIAEVERLPPDKQLHFTASHGLCFTSEPFSPTELDSSVCILKAALDSFSVGLAKECIDAGVAFEKYRDNLDHIITRLQRIYTDYVHDGLAAERYETDLLADLMGIGTFVVNQALRNLKYIHAGPSVAATSTDPREIVVRLLDIWRLGGSRRLVARAGEDFNQFVLVSLGTGEATKPMAPATLFRYLVYGENPLSRGGRRAIFSYEANLRDMLARQLPDFDNFGGIVAHAEIVSDPDVLAHH